MIDVGMRSDGRLQAEIDARVARVQSRMLDEGFDAVIVYGNTKIGGSLRYLTGYFVDRTGWVSFGSKRDEIFIFEAAGAIVAPKGNPILLIEPGHMVDFEPATPDWRGGGLTGGGSEGLTPDGVASVLSDLGAVQRVGIETWDRFPAPLYLGLKERLPNTTFHPSTVVEDVRLIKSDYEIEMFEKCGEVADAGHSAFVEALKSGPKSEVELVRIAEHAMREQDPLYEESVPASPSKICSGTDVLGCMLHAPLSNKLVEPGDVVNWDVCGRYMGYVVDTSRTRVVGDATPVQESTYRIALEMSRAVRDAARPGTITTDLIRLADGIAKGHGFRLWAMFLGHGIGLDCHERPDMGVEEMALAENMVITVEPRLVVDERYLLANEDMVIVTGEGGKAVGSFPRQPLALD